MQIAPVKDFLLVAVKGDNCSAVVYVSKNDGFVFNDELFMILKSPNFTIHKNGLGMNAI